MIDPKDSIIAFYEAIIERNAHRMFQMTPEGSKYLAELKQQINEAEFKNEYLNKPTTEAPQSYEQAAQTTHETVNQK